NVNAMIRTQWEGTNSHSTPLRTAPISLEIESNAFHMPSKDSAVPTPPETTPPSSVAAALIQPRGPVAASTGTSQLGRLHESVCACCVPLPPPPWGTADAGTLPLRYWRYA